MRVIALIGEPGTIRSILEHLGQWALRVKEHGPLLDFASGPRTPVFCGLIPQFPTSPECARAPALDPLRTLGA